MPTVCFVQSPTCLLDWDGINAVATFSAAFIALGGTAVAMRMPHRTKLRERSDTSNEILHSAGLAVKLYREAAALIPAGTRSIDIKTLAATAATLRVALDRMISRLELTDRAIMAGAGAMQLLTAVENAASKYPDPRHPKMGPKVFIPDLFLSDHIVPTVLESAQKVAKYAVKRKWPKWRSRFARIAEVGLDGPGCPADPSAR
ncbi:hypothetical protein [Sphingomonas sp.]|uniref:hypothetical protein n=1 Tax=Sphingomonas sp. TaxID=28214 RepID=UPI0028AC019F|nr:hypothetical protein [Sphingomonas sp.]